MRIKNILAISLTTLVALSPAQARDFRASDVHPLDYPTVMAVKKIGEIAAQSRRGTQANPARRTPPPDPAMGATGFEPVTPAM